MHLKMFIIRFLIMDLDTILKSKYTAATGAVLGFIGASMPEPLDNIYCERLDNYVSKEGATDVLECTNTAYDYSNVTPGQNEEPITIAKKITIEGPDNLLSQFQGNVGDHLGYIGSGYQETVSELTLTSLESAPSIIEYLPKFSSLILGMGLLGAYLLKTKKMVLKKRIVQTT